MCDVGDGCGYVFFGGLVGMYVGDVLVFVVLY